MIGLHLLASALIWLIVGLPAIVLGYPVLAILLLTKWDGRSTPWGNEKWGRATTHPSVPTTGYLSQLIWMAWRNPVYNLYAITLAAPAGARWGEGDPGIGDKYHGGFYRVRSGVFWEYYWVKPYGARCIRARWGWKMQANTGPASFVFSINPWKEYAGV